MQEKPVSWQHALATAITDPYELLDILQLTDSELTDLIDAHPRFPLRVPRHFVAQMEKGNPRDPLLLQVLPLTQEQITTPGFCQDPLQENQANPIPGLLHKYHGRVLLITTGACAIHCRYCFRSHFPYDSNTPGTSGWQSALDYIAQDRSITEVILSGGDPLVLKDPLLANLIQHLADIPSVTTVRIHTRLPIVLPERITSALIKHLTQTRLKIVVVTHCNHPKELSHSVKTALLALKAAPITLLNQSVLLHQVNDCAHTLIELSQQLFAAGVLPYYLHLPDPVQGTAHFDVSVQKGQQLLADISAKLPGYLVPKFVQEIAGQSSKKQIECSANHEE